MEEISKSFLNTVSEHYEEIKQRFNNICYKHNTKLDIDIFHDSIIKCSENAKHIMDFEEVCKYLYSAYKINILREKEYARNKRVHKPIDTLDINYIDENHSPDYIEHYTDINNIIEEIYKVFDKEIVDLYIMKLKGYAPKELEKLTKQKSLHYHFSKITNYISKYFI